MTDPTYTQTEIMTVTAARALGNDDICFVGIGLPSAACNLARLTHAPGLTLVYESGTLETRPRVLPLSHATPAVWPLGPALARTCARGRDTAAPDATFKDTARKSGSEGGRDADRSLGRAPA